MTIDSTQTEQTNKQLTLHINQIIHQSWSSVLGAWSHPLRVA